MSNQGNVIDFLKRVPSQYREDAMFRAYGRHRARNWRLMQERDEKERARKPRT